MFTCFELKKKNTSHFQFKFDFESQNFTVVITIMLSNAFKFCNKSSTLRLIYLLSDVGCMFRGLKQGGDHEPQREEAQQVVD